MGISVNNTVHRLAAILGIGSVIDGDFKTQVSTSSVEAAFSSIGKILQFGAVTRFLDCGVNCLVISQYYQGIAFCLRTNAPHHVVAFLNIFYRINFFLIHVDKFLIFSYSAGFSDSATRFCETGARFFYRQIIRVDFHPVHRHRLPAPGHRPWCRG